MNPFRPDIGILPVRIIPELIHGGGEGGPEFGFQYGQFIGKGGVEDKVSITDKGNDVLQLAPPDIMPVGQGSHRREVAVILVADHPAKQAVVGPAHEGAVSGSQLSEGFDIKAVLVTRRDGLCHVVVQAVKAVQQQDFVLSQLHLLYGQGAHSGFEVIEGDFDAPPRQEVAQMGIDEFKVKGLRAFIVVIPKLVTGVFDKVEEIVVDVEGLQPESLRLCLLYTSDAADE